MTSKKGTCSLPYHIQPASRGGSDRVSNLCVSCHECNAAKGNQTAPEFGHPQVQAQARRPLADAAAVNTTRQAVVKGLQVFGIAVRTWTGGRTRFIRDRFLTEKSHVLDALCVGEIAAVKQGRAFRSPSKLVVAGIIVGRCGTSMVFYAASNLERLWLVELRREIWSKLVCQLVAKPGFRKRQRRL